MYGDQGTTCTNHSSSYFLPFNDSRDQTQVISFGTSTSIAWPISSAQWFIVLKQWIFLRINHGPLMNCKTVPISYNQILKCKEKENQAC